MLNPPALAVTMKFMKFSEFRTTWDSESAEASTLKIARMLSYHLTLCTPVILFQMVTKPKFAPLTEMPDVGLKRSARKFLTSISKLDLTLLPSPQFLPCF